MAKVLESLEVYKTLMLAIMAAGVLILLYKMYLNSKKSTVIPAVMAKPPVNVLPVKPVESLNGLENPFDRYSSDLVKDKTHVADNRWNLTD